jgi:hypothetical protein
MKKSNSRKSDLPHRNLEDGLPGGVFATGLRAFENEAFTARRGFQVAMAVNVFGVGTLLENDLPRH